MTYYWSVRNKKLVVYPNSSGETATLFGRLSLSKITDDDLDKELVSPTLDVEIDPTDLVFLPGHMLRLLRLRVQQRLAEDSGDYERAAYFANAHAIETHNTRKVHDDLTEANSDITGSLRTEDV